MLIKEVENSHSYVISIAGMRGSGKTLLATNWFDEIDKQDNVIFIDVVGALRNYLKDNKADVQVLDINKVVSASRLNEILKQILIEKKIKRILFDVSNLKRREMIYSVDVIFSFLLQYGADYSIVIDEIGELLPQNHVYYSEETERLIRIGRNKGIKRVLITTQRLQQTDKTAITQSKYYIFFKLVHNLDLRAVREIQGISQEEFIELRVKLKKLGIGEFIITDGVKQEGIYKYDLVSKQVKEVTPFEKVSIYSKENEKQIIQQEQGQKSLIQLEDKLKAVRQYKSGKKTLTQIAKANGVSITAVHKWVKKYGSKKTKV